MKKSTKIAIYSVILLSIISCTEFRRADVQFCSGCRDTCADAGVSSCVFESPGEGSVCKCR